MVIRAQNSFWRGLAPYLLLSAALIGGYLFSPAAKTVFSSLAVIGIPIHFIASLPSTTLAAMQGRLTSTDQFRRQSEILRERNLLLQARLHRFEFLETENVRLRELLAAAPQEVEKVTLAALVAVNLERGSESVLVDKGSADGISVGQSVIDAGGIVGQITKVSLFTSKVSLISQEDQAVPTQVARSGIRAVVYGGGANRPLRVMYLDRNADIRPDDVLVTSGLGGRYPPGYPVAKVSAVQRNISESFMTIAAEPLSRLGNDREVLILWPVKQPRSGPSAADAPTEVEN